METLDQRLAALKAEMSKVQSELAAAGAKAQAASAQKLADLRGKANVAKQQAGAATHTGLTMFEAELAQLEAKVRAAVGTPKAKP
jgi:hypothetical protein